MVVLTDPIVVLEIIFLPLMVSLSATIDITTSVAFAILVKYGLNIHLILRFGMNIDLASGDQRSQLLLDFVAQGMHLQEC